jgi:hypothetical protein
MNKLVLLIMLLACNGVAQTGTTTASQSVNLAFVKREVVADRLSQYKGNNKTRGQTLKQMFESAGCNGEQLQEQPVKHEPADVICTLRGQTPEIILVGAHFDYVDRGDGVIDNWSGASLLPSLFTSLKAQPKLKHTFIFAGFSGEEQGLLGSTAYVKNLSADQIQTIRAAVIIDTLALGPTEVWASRANKEMLGMLFSTAHAMKLPLKSVNVDYFGESDEEPFIAKKIPTVTVHSLTSATLQVLHSPKDNWSAVKVDDYYESYKLLSGYLTILDHYFDPALAGGAKAK